MDLVVSTANDVTLLINNAGTGLLAGFIAAQNLEAARAEMEVNYFGALALTRTIAPTLRRNGGGAIMRVPLAYPTRLGTRVVGVFPGTVDTDLTAGFPGPKVAARHVADVALAALARGDNEVYVGDDARAVAAGMQGDTAAIERQFASLLPMETHA